MVQTDQFSNLQLPGENFDSLERFEQALTSFVVPDQELVKRPPFGFSKCPNRDVEDFFLFAAKIGKPFFKWEIIRPAFLWKLDQTITDMKFYESENLSEGTMNSVDDEEMRAQRSFIMRKASQFEGTPFTFQRLCELLTTPSRHYKRLDKFLRALEKNINVVTTVTENGERVTGVDEYSEEDDRPRGIEQAFFIKENGSPNVLKKDETTADEVKPINLSAVTKGAEECVLPSLKFEGQMEVDDTVDNKSENDVKDETNVDDHLHKVDIVNFVTEDLTKAVEKMEDDVECGHEVLSNGRLNNPVAEENLVKMEE